MGFRSGRGCWLGAALGAAGALLPLFSAAGMAAPGPPVGDTPAKIRIAFAGDSIVDNYWAGVGRIIDGNACLKDAVELGRFAKNGTGLTRGDRTYWPREIKRVDAAFRPTLSVLSIGLNDQQFIVDGNGGRTAWGAPDWIDKYRHELDEFLKGAVETRAIVLLIGMPAMRDVKENIAISEKNALFAEAIAVLGDPNLHYVEPWRLHAEGPETFASYGPDKSGRLVQIRTTDGEHFTVAGEDLVAAYLYPKIVAAFEQMGMRLDRACTRAEKAADGGGTAADRGKQP